MKKLLNYLFVFFPLVHGLSSPFFPENTEMERVQLLESILKEQTFYQLYITDDFEGNIPWKIHRSSVFLNKTEFIAKIPESEAFEYETNVYKQIHPIESNKSLMIHSYFEIPKREKVFIKPETQIVLPRGIPNRVFLWVYSNHYNMELHLLLKQGLTEIPVQVGSLKFEGWKRLEAKILVPPKNKWKHERKAIPFELTGFFIACGPFQEKGAFFIYLDQMAILLDKSLFTYPGSEILDVWDTR